ALCLICLAAALGGRRGDCLDRPDGEGHASARAVVGECRLAACAAYRPRPRGDRRREPDPCRADAFGTGAARRMDGPARARGLRQSRAAARDAAGGLSPALLRLRRAYATTA